MSSTEEHNKGFTAGVSGLPPNPAASVAETQGRQLGDELRKANENSRWTGYSARVEKNLTRISSVLAVLFFVVGAVNGYLGARMMGWGLAAQATLALLVGGFGIGVGFVVPRIIMGALVLTRIALQFAVVLAVILLVYLLYYYTTRALP